MRRGRWARGVMLAAVLVVGADQLARWAVARAVWRDDAFFDAVVQQADLSRTTVAEALQRSGQALYQGCRWHRVGLIYRVKTCFSLNIDGKLTLKDASGAPQRVLDLYFWPPRSIAMSGLPEDWGFYQLAHLERTALVVSEDRKILQDLRHD